jgi:Trk-type K+ transport system membrane component
MGVSQAIAQLLPGPHSNIVRIFSRNMRDISADTLSRDSTFVPLIWSGIFYASNGRTHIAYIDALFNSVSAFCVCGLATIDLSSLTPWQQAILFIQMNTGSTVSE